MQDEYTLDRTINTENAIVRVYRPVLTEEERNRRMQKIYTEAANLIIGVKRK